MNGDKSKYLDKQILYYDKSKWCGNCFRNSHKGCTGGRQPDRSVPPLKCECPCECGKHG